MPGLKELPSGEGGGLLKTPLDQSSLQGVARTASERSLRTGKGFACTPQPGTLLGRLLGHSFATKLQEADKALRACSLLGSCHLFSQSKSSYVIAWLRGTDLAALSQPLRSRLSFLLIDTIFIHSSLYFLNLG